MWIFLSTEAEIHFYQMIRVEAACSGSQTMHAANKDDEVSENCSSEACLSETASDKN